jgi:4-alpha-glucanotransferase
MKKRGSGILLHITSLPSPYGIGDLGLGAYRFIDFLAETKQSFWQILPLNPTKPIFDNSPYHSISAFANNPNLISLELMAQDGLLTKADIEPIPQFPKEKVDYELVINYKKGLFNLAYKRFKKNYEYERFCLENAYWLDDFSLFVALKDHFNGDVWAKWPYEIRDREPRALESFKKTFKDKIEIEKFLQYIFIKQWFKLKHYCHEKDIYIIGDIPIYVQYDSVDVWTNPEIFALDNEKRPYVVGGVPPDYFSETGQLWGNPVYRWDVLRKRRYNWWVKRIERNLKLFDYVRIDHFRGFVAYWEVGAHEKTAINGRWVEAQPYDFFNHLIRKFPCLPIIAENLGVITPDVKEVMHYFGFAGMKVLLFAFGKDLPTNPYAPHNYIKDCVVYTGTHDNNTIKGWFKEEATSEDKKRLFCYLGREVPLEELNWELIRLAMMSVAKVVIFPMQDILGLGEEARMNRPARGGGNWRWRLVIKQLIPLLTKKLLEMTEIYGRG